MRLKQWQRFGDNFFEKRKNRLLSNKLEKLMFQFYVSLPSIFVYVGRVCYETFNYFSFAECQCSLFDIFVNCDGLCATSSAAGLIHILLTSMTLQCSTPTPFFIRHF